MHRETEVDRVLGLMYESALTPERLPGALTAMTQLVDGGTCHRVAWDRHFWGAGDLIPDGDRLILIGFQR